MHIIWVVRCFWRLKELKFQIHLLASCGMPPSVLNATVDRTTEVAFSDVVTRTCDERTTYGGKLDGHAFSQSLVRMAVPSPAS